MENYWIYQATGNQAELENALTENFKLRKVLEIIATSSIEEDLLAQLDKFKELAKVALD